LASFHCSAGVLGQSRSLGRLIGEEELEPEVALFDRRG